MRDWRKRQNSLGLSPPPPPPRPRETSEEYQKRTGITPVGSRSDIVETITFMEKLKSDVSKIFHDAGQEWPDIGGREMVLKMADELVFVRKKYDELLNELADRILFEFNRKG